MQLLSRASLPRTIGDVLVGAGAAYLLDPERGPARRARLSRRARSVLNRLWAHPGAVLPDDGLLTTTGSLRFPTVLTGDLADAGDQPRSCP